MKKQFIVALFLMLGYSVVVGQIQNINPDKNGDPWIVGGIDVHNIDLEKSKSIEIKFPKDEKLALPYKVNNAEEKYFRPIFNQTGGSCSQASGIGYIFTYEINFLRNLSSNVTENQYPSHFTYNFLNEGSGENGSYYYDGYDIVMEMGVPNVKDYGGSVAAGGNQKWLSGYDKYYNGMHNRIEEYSSINVSTEEGLNDLKKWLYNHANGSNVGGLANFSCLMTGLKQTMVVEKSSKAAKTLITSWGDDGGHAMTIVGYNDSIKYDINGDGIFTNDKDNNADGKIDMKDWEVGALLFANSWGTSWNDDGFSYMMYRLLAENWYDGGISHPYMYIMTPQKTYTPELTIDLSLEYSSRNKLKIYAGITDELNSVVPTKTLEFSAFKNMGGDFYMQGVGSEDKKQIEIGLDITPLKKYLTSTSKIFLMVLESDATDKYDGQIISCKVHDYNKDQVYIGYPENEPIKSFDFITHVYGSYDDFQIETSELTKGVDGDNYSTTLTASGGKAPYTWSLDKDYQELPPNMEISEDGIFNGTATYIEPKHKWNLRFLATDSYSVTTGKILTFALEGDYTDIYNIIDNVDILIYPNPATEKIYIKTFDYGMGENIVTELINISGETVYTRVDRKESPVLEIDFDITNYSRGIYILKQTGSNKSIMKKFIIN